MKPFLIIQNDAKEGAGQLMTLIRQRSLSANTFYGWQADYEKIDLNDYCGLIVLGGAQSVYEHSEYPYLIEEMELVNAFIENKKPVIGLCLGAQIIATALGGEVLQNSQKEIGWFEIQLEDLACHDDLFKVHPEREMAFHFHGDYFKLPPDCISLARSDLTECQAFKFTENVYGFQFHAEVDKDLIDVMCRRNESYMKANGYDAESVIAESEAKLVGYELRCSFILNKWLDKAQ